MIVRRGGYCGAERRCEEEEDWKDAVRRKTTLRRKRIVGRKDAMRQNGDKCITTTIRTTMRCNSFINNISSPLLNRGRLRLRDCCQSKRSTKQISNALTYLIPTLVIIYESRSTCFVSGIILILFIIIIINVFIMSRNSVPRLSSSSYVFSSLIHACCPFPTRSHTADP